MQGTQIMLIVIVMIIILVCGKDKFFSAEGYDSPNDCPGYNTKQSHCEAPVMLELWGMRSTSSLPSLSGPLWPRVVAPDRVLSMGQIELICVIMLNWIVWNRTVLTFNCKKTVLILIWIVWNFYQNDLIRH